MKHVVNYTVEQIVLLQDFREWWIEMNKKDPNKYPLKLASKEQWDKTFEIYKKFKEKQ